jgi:integrase
LKISYLPDRNRFRIIIPARWSQTHKRVQLFFKTKQEAENKVREIRNEGLKSAEKLSDDALAFLQFAKSEYGDLKMAFESLRQHSRMVAKIKNPGATLLEASKAYLDHHEVEKSHPVTIRKYRSTLKRFSADLDGHVLPMVEVTKDQIMNVYLKRFGPGVTRMTQWSNLRAFFNWAVENQYLAANPIGDTKPMDKWESNKGILGAEDFRRILFACAEKFPRLLPFFVLGGLAGIRRGEMISSEPADRDPRIEWTDIDFKLNKIRIRQEVAKKTNAADRRRSIPLEPAAREWLQLIVKPEGPIMAISQSQLQRDKAELLDSLGLTVPENALRNSYASYGCAFRSIGDVARAMGDLEVTIKRYYVDLVDDPDLGRAWFAIFPTQTRKIVPMVA